MIYLLLRTVGFLGSDFPGEEYPNCDSSRLRLHGTVEPPIPPDRDAISRLWKEIEKNFKDHAPSIELDKIPFKDMRNLPKPEEIRNHTMISEQDASSLRDAHKAVADNLTSYPANLFANKGIIMLAGGRYSGYAPTGLGMLREFGSVLPVELWLRDHTEEKRGWCPELRQEGIACRFLSDYMDLISLRHGYQYKIFTILFSSFEQVLFLDADNIPVQNPDSVFNSQAFVEKGAVLWPDYWKSTSMPELPYIIGLTDGASEILRDEQTVESGQLLWDKKRHWDSLLLASYYNYYGPKVYYNLITQGWQGWGDKDTFPMALKSFHQDYQMMKNELKTLFVEGTVQGIGMLQADPSNLTDYHPMFLHCNVVKWSVRHFFCIGCAADSEMAVSKSFLENPDSEIHSHLTEHRRIFKVEDLAQWGIDPEPTIWKALEHTACRSVWRKRSLCHRVKDHMTKTFGFSFRSGRLALLQRQRDLPC